ncbi:hypothetical protein K1T71_004830 [Dendrolimus kikuchii]|uniref:Uncharacterized protein n=1 Tax=Dendrolimus kikuchii TaxID=765133 RepID=A0ACC1D5E3_9NEOP|nr:hypothetical protein K1T71_004830 [Dendrolimus kikuchii]
MTSVSLEESPLQTDVDQNDTALEKILSKFRPLGPFYIRFMPLLMFSSLTNSWFCMNYVFAAANVDYRCKYNCENVSEFIETALNITTNAERCLKYPLIDTNGTCSADNFNVTNAITCTEWVYKDPYSFVAEFNLGCQDWKRTLVGTARSIGYMIGLLLLGPVSDKIGRKKLIIFTGITGAVAGLVKSFTYSYWLYIALEVTDGLLGDTYSPNYMLGVEMVSKQNRVYFAPLMIGTMAVGGIILSATAWLFPYWRYFLRIIYAPALLYILYPLFLDESVRWLLIKGKKEDAKDIIRKAAKINKTVISEELITNVQCRKNVANTNILRLLKITISSKKLLLRFLACCCMWIAATFNKYSLLINSVSLEGNKYVNYALTAFADLPACILLTFVLIRFQRKKPLIGSFLLTGMFCVVQSFMKGYPTTSISLFFIGKLMSAIAYATVYLYTTELFPTYTRNTMHALCSSVGRIGSILAPQTPLLLRFWTGLPSVIVGGLSLITGVIIMLMPDTAEDVLPDTVKEAESLGTRTTYIPVKNNEEECVTNLK